MPDYLPRPLLVRRRPRIPHAFGRSKAAGRERRAITAPSAGCQTPRRPARRQTHQLRKQPLVYRLLQRHSMIREAEALVRKQRFLLCRYLLILVTGALGLLQSQGTAMAPVMGLVALALVSNMYLGTVSPFSFFDASMQAPILVTDTAMVSAVLLVSRASQEFFLFFFFVLIMAAKIENLLALAVAALLIALASLL